MSPDGSVTGRQQVFAVPAQGCAMPSQTKAAFPMRPVMGHDQADEGNTDAKSARKAIAAEKEQRHRIIENLNAK